MPATRWPYGEADRSVRASDQDREAAIALLNEHTTAGRLRLDEFEERVAAVYAAQALSDIDQQLHDLPVQRKAAAEPEPVGVALWQMWMPWLTAGIICWVIWGISEITPRSVPSIRGRCGWSGPGAPCCSAGRSPIGPACRGAGRFVADRPILDRAGELALGKLSALGAVAQPVRAGDS